MRASIALLCTTIAFYGAPVAAETPTGSQAAVTTGGDEQIAELEAERDALSMRGPKLGMIWGGIATIVGGGTLVTAAIGCRYGGDIFFGDHNDSCRSSGWTGYWIAGGVVAGLGITALASSAIVFTARKRERSALDRRIRELRGDQAARPAPVWSVGPTFAGSSGMGVQVGVRF